jgi:PAS domain S-box-containing protein
MRTNLPVSKNEFFLNDHFLIQSKTDLDGRITSVNEDFAFISGFSQEELIGQPHNIVRHPDTPTEIFIDLWRTLNAGKIWTGYLKNRRKNGDFYWVKTDVSPLRKDSRIVGYVSSRWKMSTEDKDKYEHYYSLFRDGKSKGLKIQEGEVVKTRSILGTVADLMKK